jgi:hypothetical protein
MEGEGQWGNFFFHEGKREQGLVSLDAGKKGSLSLSASSVRYGTSFISRPNLAMATLCLSFWLS